MKRPSNKYERVQIRKLKNEKLFDDAGSNPNYHTSFVCFVSDDERHKCSSFDKKRSHLDLHFIRPDNEYGIMKKSSRISNTKQYYKNLGNRKVRRMNEQSLLNNCDYKKIFNVENNIW